MTRNRPKSAAKAGSTTDPAERTSQPRRPQGSSLSPTKTNVLSKRTIWIAVSAAALIVAAAGLSFHFFNGSESWNAGSASAATFVGSETCAGCHRAEAELWHGSQHQRAMDHATGKSVLGDFNDTSFDYYGVQSRFFRKDGKFLVETDGPDGKLATFEVKYTFGIDPLQQYLVEFPDGRLQALSLAWDSRPKERGGQRWFHLYPNEEIKHDDILHWTKLNQNWNFMCVGVPFDRRAQELRRGRMIVSTPRGRRSASAAKTCHGQGSHHVAWARDRQSWWPFGKTRGSRPRVLPFVFDERQQRHVADRSANAAIRSAIFHSAYAAQRGRDLRVVPCTPG